MNYNNKHFKAVLNSDNGEIDAETVFVYKQSDNILSCEYKGSKIRSGHLIGLVDDHGNIDMRYHQVNDRGEIMTGVCRSRPEILSNGKIRLHESWRWTSGDLSEGQSILEEI